MFIDYYYIIQNDLFCVYNYFFGGVVNVLEEGTNVFLSLDASVFPSSPILKLNPLLFADSVTIQKINSAF